VPSAIVTRLRLEGDAISRCIPMTSGVSCAVAQQLVSDCQMPGMPIWITGKALPPSLVRPFGTQRTEAATGPPLFVLQDATVE
jgi:hypothetical protein